MDTLHVCQGKNPPGSDFYKTPSLYSCQLSSTLTKRKHLTLFPPPHPSLLQFSYFHSFFLFPPYPMSTHSPSRRIRTKTTELSDFFRGTAPPSSAQKEPSSSLHLEVPSSDTDVNSKKRVKIQLFGRSRKKSNQSTASSPVSSSRDSSEFGTLGEPSIRTASSSDR